MHCKEESAYEYYYQGSSSCLASKCVYSCSFRVRGLATTCTRHKLSVCCARRKTHLIVSVPSTLFCTVCCRMALVLAQALRSDGSVRNKDPSVVGPGSNGGGRIRGRREAIQKLISFAFRLDVIVVSAIFVILLLPFALLVSTF